MVYGIMERLFCDQGTAFLRSGIIRIFSMGSQLVGSGSWKNVESGIKCFGQIKITRFFSFFLFETGINVKRIFWGSGVTFFGKKKMKSIPCLDPVSNLVRQNVSSEFDPDLRVWTSVQIEYCEQRRVPLRLPGSLFIATEKLLKGHVFFLFVKTLRMPFKM